MNFPALSPAVGGGGRRKNARLLNAAGRGKNCGKKRREEAIICAKVQHVVRVFEFPLRRRERWGRRRLLLVSEKKEGVGKKCEMAPRDPPPPSPRSFYESQGEAGGMAEEGGDGKRRGKGDLLLFLPPFSRHTRRKIRQIFQTLNEKVSIKRTFLLFELGI